VSNTGSSIGKGEEERIFEKFYRARTEVKGCGLGLAICKGIVQLHGGTIWAESGDNEVSISVRLPISEQPLILDDSPDLRI
ncbi:MAG: histidine kinase, partial [Cyanobacteria bacterium]|nr:histidine kinase [Cyanobacteriota bacterium]